MFRTIITMLAGALVLFLIAYGLGCHKGKVITQQVYVNKITHDTIRDTVSVLRIVPKYITNTVTQIKQLVTKDTVYKAKYVDRIQYVDRDIKSIKYDTVTLPTNTPVLVYKDSVVKADYTLSYSIRTIGLLDGFDYSITTNKLKASSNPKQKFFSNLLFGYRLDNDKQIGGQLGYGRINLGYLYSIDSRTHNVLVGVKLF